MGFCLYIWDKAKSFSLWYGDFSVRIRVWYVVAFWAQVHGTGGPIQPPISIMVAKRISMVIDLKCNVPLLLLRGVTVSTLGFPLFFSEIKPIAPHSLCLFCLHLNVYIYIWACLKWGRSHLVIEFALFLLSRIGRGKWDLWLWRVFHKMGFFILKKKRKRKKSKFLSLD